MVGMFDLANRLGAVLACGVPTLLVVLPLVRRIVALVVEPPAQAR